MEAHRLRAATIAAVAVALLGASYRTPNFVVQTADPRLAEHFAKTAETLRRALAVEWLGQEMPDWSQPCPITVQVGPHLGAGGATSFLFDGGEVYGWRMNIQGSAERVVDSVLPHEITHMIFASYFRAPLPRWADEGGATSVECPSEQAKHRKMLVQFLRTGRGIAFSDMFAMTEYPDDVMPLYAQGYSLADYLIQQGGRRKYVAFLAEGMRDHRWAAALARWYGFKDLATLQNQWVGWVAQGCPRLQAPAVSPEGASPAQLAGSDARPKRPEPNLIFHVAGTPGGNASVEFRPLEGPIRAQLTRPQPIQQK
ncbi:MAG: hypothetical protein NUV77_22205 [Thermoguttaceae bacterium]|jgi:hypothetical protein|nr:hypothetical protein [Thermoguttaceae bacterium]